MSENQNIEINTSRGKSKVWLYFGSKHENGIKVEDDCLHCVICFRNGKKTAYKDKNSTSTLMYHLRSAHDMELAELSQAEKNVKSLRDPNNIPASTAEKKALLGRRTGIWSCVDLRSARSFATEGFLEWAIQNRVISSTDEFPTAQTIAGSALNDVFIIVLDKLKHILQNAPKVIIVLVDMWTDAYAKVPYINLSVQFIDSNFRFHCYKIFTERFDHPHTSARIAEKITKILKEVDLDDRNFFLTGDAAFACVGAARFLNKCLGYMKCVAHSLHNLLTSDAKKSPDYDEIEQVLFKIKRTHGKIVYKTTELKELYEAIQREDVLNYLSEWEGGLTEAMEADEHIHPMDPEQFQRARLEQEALAEAGQEPFSSFKQTNVTRWFSTLAMLSSYDKNLGM